MNEQNIRSTFCITLLDGSCWAIPGEDREGNPTVRFMPVQKYGMSKCVEPFLREQYLCIYPAEPGIEEHYKEFIAKYHNYLQKEFN